MSKKFFILKKYTQFGTQRLIHENQYLSSVISEHDIDREKDHFDIWSIWYNPVTLSPSEFSGL